MQEISFDIPTLRKAYASGLTVMDVIDLVIDRISKADDPGIFLHIVDRETLRETAGQLGEFDESRPLLWGIPYAVKDNIDVAGIPTTAACPDYAYMPDEDAHCIKRLRQAGAIMVGKTNLDQFATGLVGIRTPYPAPKNPINPKLIPGGSSSGSAVAVARGLVSFALGTDTAGSGRIPAAMNNIVGLKPTRGALSCSGVVPACKSLDTVSIFAGTVDDAHAVLRAASEKDEADPYSKKFAFANIPNLPPEFKVGVPDQKSRIYFQDKHQAQSFDATLEHLQSMGATVQEIDFKPFYQIAELLYTGAWIAERYAVLENFIREKPDSIHPVTYKVIKTAESMTAVDAFRDKYSLDELKYAVSQTPSSVDMLCVPTLPRMYTVSEVEASPIEVNSKLGVYTNFVNLLDLCGLAVPVEFRKDGLPGSVTLLSVAGADDRIAAVGRALHHGLSSGIGAKPYPLPAPNISEEALQDHEMAVALVGAHMSGLPLNPQIVELGGRFIRKARTAPHYKLYLLDKSAPIRPGLVRSSNGTSIDLEIWSLPKNKFGYFMEQIGAPLGIGTIFLEDDEQVKGFICEVGGLEGSRDLTEYGGWRNYLKELQQV